jgi:hypothetical protein
MQPSHTRCAGMTVHLWHACNFLRLAAQSSYTSMLSCIIIICVLSDVPQ